MTAPADTRISDELLPCPFCGAPAEIVHIDEGENEGGSCVCCTRCLASSNVEFEFKENFVANWNRRSERERRAQAVTVPDGWVKKARAAFVAAVREQDAGWTNEADEGEELLVSPDGDYFALDLPIIAAFAAAPPPATAGVTPTHRHKKRGTEYILISYGKMQADNWHEVHLPSRSYHPVDMREVAIYRSVDDGSLWARPKEEFEDGRFEVLP